MKKSYAVLGMGRFGSSIAVSLSELGADVLAIDSDEELLNRVADKVTCAISIDVRNPEALKSAGISNMDAVIISMAEFLESSIMAVMTAKSVGVPLVMAKARDELMGEILSKVGADKILYPERESGINLSKKLMSNDFLEYFDLSDTVALIEMLPKKEWIGKSLRNLNLRKEYKINVIAIRQKNDVNVVMDPDETLSGDCPLLVTLKKSDLKKLL
ncbi:MAG: TrkA family potassium uptake protein [Lachnospiraceae bacterium]|nr:TrkA family potassium uptake protein [Lachnospiraceae bacterium]